MKTAFELANVLGGVYRSGNILFVPPTSPSLASSSSTPLAPPPNVLYSPTGNRLTVIDLDSQSSHVLPAQLRKPIHLVAINPANPALLLLVDHDGRAILVNARSRATLAHINFKARVRAASFSPNGAFLAVATGSQVRVWRTPNALLREFSPFVLHRTYVGHHDDVLSICWSASSSFFLTTSKDMTARLYSRDPFVLPHAREAAAAAAVVASAATAGNTANSMAALPKSAKFRPKTFSGHRAPVLAAYWSQDETEIYTVAKDGACFVWRAKLPSDEDGGLAGWDEDGDEDDDDDDAMDLDRDRGSKLPSTRSSTNSAPLTPDERIATTRWGLASRHYFNAQSTGVSCVAFHAPTSLLVVGFATGVFGLYAMPDCSNLHTLSIASGAPLSSVCINASGTQLGLACSEHAQLMVWEWASESYVLKQQGHHYDMNAVAFSADGQVAATGGDDGKVKLWNTQTGFCIATFTEHDAPVSALQFASRGQVLFSASLDGTVRAWDLLRYRNFRTLTSATPVQFGCLAVEPSGEVVCAGAAGGGAGGMSTADTFDIYLWSVQTGKLLDTISGHEAPVADVAFHPGGTGTLVSTSWDRSVRIHEVFRRSAGVEPLHLTSDGLAVAFSPDGNLFAVATLDGQLAFFEPRQGRQLGVLDCRRDMARGRATTDRSAGGGSSGGGGAFTTLAFSADGSCVLAGGNANRVCLYDVRERVLLRSWTLSLDLSLEGTQERLDSRRMTDAGFAVDEIDDRSDEEELDAAQRADRSLPGAQRGDAAKRTTRPLARAKCVRFDPTGRSWAAASTAGLLVYSLDAHGASSGGGGVGGGLGSSFDPLELDLELTPRSVRLASAQGRHLEALVGALRLGEPYLVVETYERTPAREVGLVVAQLPSTYLVAALRLVASRLSSGALGDADAQRRSAAAAAAADASKAKGDAKSLGQRVADADARAAATAAAPTRASSPHVEFHLTWLRELLTLRARELRREASRPATAAALRAVGAALHEVRHHVRSLAERNVWSYLYVWNAMGGGDGGGDDDVDEGGLGGQLGGVEETGKRDAKDKAGSNGADEQRQAASLARRLNGSDVEMVS